MADGPTREVAFVTGDKPFELRMTKGDIAGVIRAAGVLKARWIVASYDHDIARDLPVWEVFEVRKIQKNNPTPGAYMLPAASRAFTCKSIHPAIMWALAQGTNQ